MNLVEYVEQYAPVQMRKFFSDNMHIIEAISEFLESERDSDIRITPDISQIFSSLHLISMDREGLLSNSLKVVICLQDPYQQGCAHGVAMSTLNGEITVSLRNVYRVLKSYKKDIPKFTSGDIRGWCTQGVLLWNAALTTRLGTSKAHTKEWSIFTYNFIRWLSTEFKFLVFVLLGADAKAYQRDIDLSRHVVLTTSHPVARENSNTFLTSDIFTKVNEVLVFMEREPVRWEEYSYVPLEEQQ